eukprot:4767488-Amphidinium_carterae.1
MWQKVVAHLFLCFRWSGKSGVWQKTGLETPSSCFLIGLLLPELLRHIGVLVQGCKAMLAQ